ncbi:UPF0158 family protein [Pirellulales bacterium]|nr:UPF0158 family protein [Pirellulales bacterium]
MTRLDIDWLALEIAFDDCDDEFGTECANYFDRESGRVICIDEEIRGVLDIIIDEVCDGLDEGQDWTEEAVSVSDEFQQLSAGEQLAVLAAINIEYGEAEQFEQIPHFDSHESFEWMRNFIDTIDDHACRNQLREAIAQRKPFRRFREVLASDRRVQHQWLAFESARQREAMIEWLRSIGIEPANPESSMRTPLPLPDLRDAMFTEVRQFVRSARTIDGVERIALIGSLAQNKEFPKDIDLLVTVADGCDLAMLATLGRKLSGHMNSCQAGADVFLASDDGKYIGRTCPWRHCDPGVRTSCDALHCGRRPYLHDDFESIRLNDDLIAHPPVVLWPDTLAVSSVPSDVRQQLTDALAEDATD